jgi:hypothetical protein
VREIDSGTVGHPLQLGHVPGEACVVRVLEISVNLLADRRRVEGLEAYV